MTAFDSASASASSADHRRLRLYVDAPLAADVEFPAAADHAHRLRHVMRLRDGDYAHLFNGRDGEWRARITLRGRREVTLTVEERIAAQDAPCDLWLLFAPLKKARTDYAAQKAAELGVSAVRPVLTRRTIAERVNCERLQANLIEGAEQCGRRTAPTAQATATLDATLRAWPAERWLMYCDEAGAGGALATLAALPETARAAPWAVLVGPEGGFDPQERAALRAQSRTVPVSLGPRIMRADTAAVAALTLWQAALGDLR